MSGVAPDAYTYEQLKRIADSIDDRRGWDFSRMQTEREPVPWDYLEIVPRFLKPTDAVLDIGTGGGEKFLTFSRSFERGVGIDPDPDMIQAARENGATQPNVTFVEMAAEALAFPEVTFDVVLTRHAPTVVPEVVRVLKPGGYFVSQQVGSENMATIVKEFGTASNVPYDDEYRACVDDFTKRGCRIVATGAYNVHYWVKDIPSLIFWLKALAGGNEVPEGFSIERDWRTISRIIATYATPRGVLTNEHRTLLIVQKEE
jgi:ubiquinone/menaquinone biosynthesis C-methylase UbiE